MKIITIKVGAKGTRKPLPVPGKAAETIEDMQTLSRGALPVILRCFNRGWRIECQERSGARDLFREGAADTAVAAAVAEYNPTEVVARAGRPRKPVELKVPKGKKTFTLDELRAALANQPNVKLVVEGEAAAPTA